MRALPIVIAALLAGCTAEPPAIEARDAWVRVGGHGGAAYVTLTNSGGADRLVGVSASLPASLHGTTNDGGVMRMRALDGGLAIPAGGRVALKPMGDHIMLHGPIAGPVPLTLTFEQHAPITITAELRK